MTSQKDITGTTIYVCEVKLSELMHTLSVEQRRFSKIFALTTRNPDEIWQAMEADQNQPGHWLPMRTYLQFLNLSDTDIAATYGISVVKFVFNKRWELHSLNILLGEQTLVDETIDQTIRNGRPIYSKSVS